MSPATLTRLARALLLGIPLMMGPTCPGEAVNPDDDASGDDDDSVGLCSGPGCVNSDDCPAAEPADGDACGFSGNCHFCTGGADDAARGYTCDGYSFAAAGTYDCTP